ncbi:MAG: hypothetical protein KC731_21010 [Myxococcales bacterium]|nr:hypothetical protein [Myxococcales bacterium]
MLSGCANVLGLDEYRPESGAGGDGAGGRGAGGRENGAPCSEASQCDSDFCANMVCCESACADTCASCALEGKEGICTPLEATTSALGCTGVCDGEGHCASTATSVKIWGGQGDQQGLAVAASPEGSFAIAGRFFGLLDFGLGQVTHAGAGGNDGLVVLFDAAGQPVWSDGPGGANNDELYDVAISPTGDVLAVGYSTGGFNFGSLALTFGGDGDAMALMYQGTPDGTTAVPLWGLNVMTSPTVDAAYAVDFDAEGTAWIGGIVGDGGSGSNGATTDGFLVSVKSGLVQGVDLRFGSPSSAETIATVDVDRERGRVLVTGAAQGALNVPGIDTPGLGEEGDAFVALLDLSGNVQKSRVFASQNGGSQIRGAAFSATGAFAVVGDIVGSYDFGGGPSATQATDIFIALFDADGELTLTQVFNAPGNQSATGVTYDPEGRLVIVGNLEAPVELGPMAPALFVQQGMANGMPTTDPFLARFSAEGGHLVSFAYGDTDVQTLWEVAASDTQVHAIGYAAGTFGVNDSTIETQGETDIFLMTLP